MQVCIQFSFLLLWVFVGRKEPVYLRLVATEIMRVMYTTLQEGNHTRKKPHKQAYAGGLFAAIFIIIFYVYVIQNYNVHVSQKYCMCVCVCL